MGRERESECVDPTDGDRSRDHFNWLNSGRYGDHFQLAE
jgi:hypothetical protein